MKPLRLNQQQQQQYAARFSQECENLTMSWTPDLRQWHHLALAALDYANLETLNVPAAKYRDLFREEKHGLNLNVVAALANNLEQRTPSQMGMKADEWADVLDLNSQVGLTWEALVEPVHRRLHKEFEIMGDKPKLIVAGEA